MIKLDNYCIIVKKDTTMKVFLVIILSLFFIMPSIAVQPREKAYDFEALAVMPDLSFKTVKLSDYSGKYLVLLFYPFDFTYVCPTEIISYSSKAKEFREIDTEVLAISVDSHFSHLAWRRTARKDGGLGEIEIPLVSDITKEISDDYGVLVSNSSDPLYGASLRGLIIIDPKGIIRSITINDEQVGRNVD